MRIKRFSAVILTIVLVFAMAVPAFAAAPTIVSHPQSATVVAGQSTTLSVYAYSDVSATLTYQWYCRMPSGSVSACSYETSPTMTISGGSTAYSGAQFYCIVTDALGQSVSSNPATLTIVSSSAPVTTGGYTLTVQGGTISGSGSSANFREGAVVTIVAYDSQYAFNGWTTSGGGIFSAPTSKTTTFTMPAANVTVSATFNTSISSGGTAAISGSMESRTVTDAATGLAITGNMMSSAALTVTKDAYHSGDSACQTIAAQKSAGSLYSLYNVALTSPGVTGDAIGGTVSVVLPVGAKNGTAVTVYHCRNGVLQQANGFVNNNSITIVVDTLGVFAVGSTTGAAVTSTGGVPAGTTSATTRPPQTGDSATTAGFAMLALLALAGAAVIVKKVRG